MWVRFTDYLEHVTEIGPPPETDEVAKANAGIRRVFQVVNDQNPILLQRPQGLEQFRLLLEASGRIATRNPAQRLVIPKQLFHNRRVRAFLAGPMLVQPRCRIHRGFALAWPVDDQPVAIEHERVRSDPDIHCRQIKYALARVGMQFTGIVVA